MRRSALQRHIMPSRRIWHNVRLPGEKITDESPLFRSEFDPNPITHSKWYYRQRIRSDFRDKYIPEGASGGIIPADVLEKDRIDKIKHPEPLRFWSIDQYIGKRCEDLRIGNRKVTPKTESGRKVFHEIQTIHGFRKFANTTMDIAGVNNTVNEMLLNHRLKGMEEHYRRWPLWMKLVEYWKAVPDLTIDKTNVLEVKVKQAEKEKKEVEIVAAEKRGQLHEDYRAELRAKDAAYDNLMKKFQYVMDNIEHAKGKVIPYKPTPELAEEALEEDPRDKEIRELKESRAKLEQRLAELENKE